MKLKDLFKKKMHHPEFLPDEELVSAVREDCGNYIANLVKNRIDTAKEHEADVAALETELENFKSYADNRICQMSEANIAMFSDLCAIVGSLPVSKCGKFCANGIPGQSECPTRDMTKDPKTGLTFCTNCYADAEWHEVLDKTNPRALLLRKSRNGRITDEEKEELLRSTDSEVE